MKIAFYVSRWWPEYFDGATKTRYEIWRRLCAEGYDCQMAKSYGLAPTVDVIITHPLAAEAVLRHSRAKCVVTLHRPEMIHLVPPEVTAVVCNTDVMRDMLPPHLKDKAIVLHPMVPYGDAIPSTYDQRSKVGYLGGRESRKNPDFLERIGWTPGVELILPRPSADISNVFRQFGILVMPSLHEAYGRVAVEAATRGIPCLSSDLPGTREACAHKYLPVPTMPWLDPFWAVELALLQDYDTYRAAREQARDDAARLRARTEREWPNFLQMLDFIG